MRRSLIYVRYNLDGRRTADIAEDLRSANNGPMRRSKGAILEARDAKTAPTGGVAGAIALGDGGT